MRAILFDFDGTILDTETPELTAWQEVYARFGIPLPLELWHSTVGRGWGDSPFHPQHYLEAQLGYTPDWEAVHAERRACFSSLLNVEKIRPGIEALLAFVQENRLATAVVSSSRHEWVDKHLKRLEIFDLFPVISCADDVPRAKPHPDLYHHALTQLALSSADALAIEDTPTGITAAKSAGLYCIAYPNPVTATLDLAHADAYAHDGEILHHSVTERLARHA